MANLREGLYGSYYGSLYGESEPLSQDEMNVNALYIASYLSSKGWTLNSIAGLLGNLEVESSINPGRWQSDDVGNTSMGFGLVQWTPATKYLNWCSEKGYSDASEMDNNLSRIIYEVENNLQWIATDSYNYSFKEFTESNDSPSQLAKAFILNYERPADQSETAQSNRSLLAIKYSFIIRGNDPVTPTIRKRKKFKFPLFIAGNRRRDKWINQNFWIE